MKAPVKKPVTELTVIFDGECLLCRRSVAWLEGTSKYVELNTRASSDPEVMSAHGHVPGYGDNMVVVADDGRTWVGPPDAYLVVMWAVRGMRLLSYVAALPVLRTITAGVLRFVTANRQVIGRGLSARPCERCAT